MNSRNKLAALWLGLIFLTIQNVSRAQNSFEYSAGNFSVGLSSINPGQTPFPAYYTVFIETGNGRYIKSGRIDDAKKIPLKNFAYPYKIKNGSKALATVTSYYDTTPRPPRHTAISVSNPGDPLPLEQVFLPVLTGKPYGRIAIDPCVQTVVPGDTMSVSLIYKPYSSAGTYTIIAFYYNKPLEGGNIFSPISESTEYSFNASEQTKAIRRHNTESVFTTIPDGLPVEVSSRLNTAHSGYTNALYFMVPAGLPEVEKNIFLSLAPTRNTLSYNQNTSTAFYATIMQYNSSGIMEQKDFLLPLGINMYAHDPNGISTSPHCFMDNEGLVDPHNIRIMNNIHFTNDGPGYARTVEVTVTVPDGITIPLPFSSAYVFVNGTTKLFKPQLPGEKNYYKITGNKIIFTMKDVFLKGTVAEKELSKRTGMITFTLKTNAAPLSVPDCMYTYASIAFFNRDNTPNKPIIKWDLIRSNCNNTTPCPRYSKAGGPDTR